MDHESAALTLVDNGTMTPLLGPMGVGHLPRKGWGGVGLHLAEVIDGHWLRKAAMDHEWAALTLIDLGARTPYWRGDFGQPFQGKINWHRVY
jgi:hypothetical protein